MCFTKFGTITINLNNFTLFIILIYVAFWDEMYYNNKRANKSVFPRVNERNLV